MRFFEGFEKAPIVGMIQCHTPEECREKIAASLAAGADALGLQLEQLLPEYRNSNALSSVFAACPGRPIYLTSYRNGSSEGLSEEERAELLLLGAQAGIGAGCPVLCDICGDAFDPNPLQMTEDTSALARQQALMGQLRALGAEILLSTHDFRDLGEEDILQLLRRQRAHGADAVKIVVSSASEERLPEYIRLLQRLKRELGCPFLVLDSGACSGLIRRIGPALGCCMFLCVAYHGEKDTPAQPLISQILPLREQI